MSGRQPAAASRSVFVICDWTIEQDHRAIKRRIQASLGFRSFASAERTIQGYEAIHMIRKGQVRWLAKGDIAEQVRFVKYIFALSA